MDHGTDRAWALLVPKPPCSFASGLSDIVWQSAFAHGVSLAECGSKLVFEQPGVYMLHLSMNSDSGTDTPAGLVVSASAWNGRSWILVQNQEACTAWNGGSTLTATFMLQATPQQLGWKLQLANNTGAAFEFASGQLWSRLMVHKVS